jgi:DNA (cytosine-5)-methyltransferase 1
MMFRYQVRFALLNAAHYGAPQRRLRFFLIGALSGHPLPDLPQPSHAYAGPSLDIKFPYYLEKQLIKSIRVTPGTALHRTVTIEDAIGDLPPFDWYV